MDVLPRYLFADLILNNYAEALAKVIFNIHHYQARLIADDNRLRQVIGFGNPSGKTNMRPSKNHPRTSPDHACADDWHV